MVTLQVALHDIRGFLPSRLAHFLMNLRLTRCPFYLSRHGQSVYNEQGKIGGDSLLTQHGEVTSSAVCPCNLTHEFSVPSELGGGVV